jgi:RNase P subunit RPR2
MAKNKTRLKREARIKVNELFVEALAQKDIAKGTDLIRKARNLAMKHRMRLPREHKRRFCKHCYSYLIPGKNCRVRTQGEHVVYTCQECNKFMRFPYSKE